MNKLVMPDADCALDDTSVNQCQTDDLGAEYFGIITVGRHLVVQLDYSPRSGRHMAYM